MVFPMVSPSSHPKVYLRAISGGHCAVVGQPAACRAVGAVWYRAITTSLGWRCFLDEILNIPSRKKIWKMDVHPHFLGLIRLMKVEHD